jgi:hypothetical protein
MVRTSHLYTPKVVTMKKMIATLILSLAACVGPATTSDAHDAPAAEELRQASTTTLCRPGNFHDFNTGDVVSTACRKICNDPCLPLFQVPCTSTGGQWVGTNGITYNKCFKVTP